MNCIKTLAEVQRCHDCNDKGDDDDGAKDDDDDAKDDDNGDD